MLARWSKPKCLLINRLIDANISPKLIGGNTVAFRLAHSAKKQVMDAYIWHYKEDEWEVPRRYGLICSMGYGGGGEIASAMNRVENHAKIEEAFRKTIPVAAKAGVPNVITFSGNREGMSDEEGAKNTILGLNRVKKIAEDNGVNICIELLNSKVDHHDYMCDHSAWGLKVVQAVNSSRVKLSLMGSSPQVGSVGDRSSQAHNRLLPMAFL